jgi:hypothetical protein
MRNIRFSGAIAERIFAVRIPPFGMAETIRRILKEFNISPPKTMIVPNGNLTKIKFLLSN